MRMLFELFVSFVRLVNSFIFNCAALAALVVSYCGYQDEAVKLLAVWACVTTVRLSLLWNKGV